MKQRLLLSTLAFLIVAAFAATVSAQTASTLTTQLSTTSSGWGKGGKPKPTPTPTPGPLIDPDGTWTFNTNGGPSAWSLTTNWLGGIVADGGGFADFSTINITGARNPNVDTTSRTVRRLDIGDTNNTHSYTISASGGASLIFDNTANSANAQLNQTSGSAGDIISAPVILNSSLDITNASVSTLTLSGAISAGTAGTKTIATSTGAVTLSGIIGNGSGTVAVAQNGPGTLTLTAANTYSGGTSVTGGILEVGVDSTAAGGVITSGPVGTGTLTLNDGSTLRSNNATGRTLRNSIISSGSITLGAGATQTGTLTFSIASITIPPTWTLAGDTTLTTNVATTINPVISGGFSLTKDGAAALTLGATNTYTGDTVIKAGTINIGTTQTLGSTSTPGTLKLSGGTLNTTTSRSVTTAAIPNNISVTADSAITTTSTSGTVDLNFTGTLTGTGGTLTFRNDAASGTGVFDVRLSAGDFTMSRPIVIANGAFGTTRLSDFNTSATTHTYNGLISGAGIFRRTASTAGTGGDTIFNAANTFSGGVQLNDGAIGLGIDSVGAAGSVTSGPLGTGTLTVGGAGANVEAIYASGGARTVNNAVTINSGSLLTVKGSNNLTLGGVISGSGALTKTEAGTLTVTNTNTYTSATTVNAGKLFVNGSLASGSAVTVNNSGSVLGGTGTINGTVSIASSGAIIEGGTGSTGQTLTLNNSLTLSSGSIIELALGPSLAHSTLARTGAGTWTFDSTQKFTFIDLGATAGTYDNIISGLAADPGSEGSWTITNSGFVGTFAYDGAGGIDLTLTAVPEPSTWVAGGLALLAVCYTQRRRFARTLKRA